MTHPQQHCLTHRAAEELPSAWVEAAADGRLMGWNSAAEELVGCALGTSGGESAILGEWLGVTDAATLEQGLRGARLHGQARVALSAGDRELDLRVRHCGRCGRFSILLDDITHQLHQVESVADVQSWFRRSERASCIIARDGRLTVVNDEMVAWVGADRPTRPQMGWESWMSDSELSETLAQAVAAGFRGERRVVVVHTARRDARTLVMSPLRQSGGRVESVVIEDVAMNVAGADEPEEVVAAVGEVGPEDEVAPEDVQRCLRIILVDDDDAVRGMAERALRNAGHHVDTVADAQSAVDLAAGGSCDVLVTDVVLRGGLSGPELAEQLRSERRTRAVLFVSGWGVDGIVDDLDTERAQGFLAKPFRAAELVERVAQLDRAARQQLRPATARLGAQSEPVVRNGQAQGSPAE